MQRVHRPRGRVRQECGRFQSAGRAGGRADRVGPRRRGQSALRADPSGDDRGPVHDADQRQLRSRPHPQPDQRGASGKGVSRARMQRLRLALRADGGLRHEAAVERRRGRALAEIAYSVRSEGHGGLRLPRAGAWLFRRDGEPLLLRGTGRRGRGMGRAGPAAHRAEGGRGQPEVHGAAGSGQHRDLRHARAHACDHEGGEGAVHRGLGPRSARPETAAGADRGPGRERLHPRRDACRLTPIRS